jgi:tryptophanyl-tRNA synthetase
MLAKNLNELLAPMLEKRAELEKDVSGVWDVLKSSAEALRPIASQTMEETRKAMGLP